MLITYIALGVAVIALYIAYTSNRRAEALEARLGRYNSTLYEVSDKVDELKTQFEEQTRALRAEIKLAGGNFKFAPAMTVGEAAAAHPQVQMIMAGFHLGGCSSCAVSPDETLEHACRSHGVDQAALLNALNGLIGANAASAIPSFEPMKLPNVQLHL